MESKAVSPARVNEELPAPSFGAIKRLEDPSWRPYCLVCSSARRMKAEVYGYQCFGCKNQINFDLTHYTP
jgi:hypothetical protein